MRMRVCIVTWVHWPVSQTFAKFATQNFVFFLFIWIWTAEIYIRSHHIVSKHSVLSWLFLKCATFWTCFNFDLHQCLYAIVITANIPRTSSIHNAHLMAKLLQISTAFLHSATWIEVLTTLSKLTLIEFIRSFFCVCEWEPNHCLTSTSYLNILYCIRIAHGFCSKYTSKWCVFDSTAHRLTTIEKKKQTSSQKRCMDGC